MLPISSRKHGKTLEASMFWMAGVVAAIGVIEALKYQTGAHAGGKSRVVQK